MKKIWLFLFLSISPTLIFSSRASAVFWVYLTPGVKGTVLNARTGRPLEGVKVSYDIYRGVGRMYRSSYRLFKHVEATTNAAGEYFLPGVLKPFWLVEPRSVLLNCFMPGMGLHAGFSHTDVTLYKDGYRSVITSKDELTRQPHIRLWPLLGPQR